MPEQFRTLIVILMLAAPFFYFASRPVSVFITAESFTRKRNLWFGLTLAAFLASNFWIFLAFSIPLLIYAKRRESNSPALFFFILFVLPVATIEIPGMGLINFLFDLSYLRVLSLIILLPAFLILRGRSDTPSFGRTVPDKALGAYLLLIAMLFLRGDSLTDFMRQIFYLFIDIFLPYFVISRSLKNMQSFRDALLSLVLAIMVLSPLALFESLKHWLLYSSVNFALGMTGGMTHYLGREGMIRVIVSAGQPIALGYLMTVGIGLYLFLQRSIQQKFARQLGMALLIAGLIAPLSRGPWIGALVLLVVFMLTGRNPARRLMSMAMAALIILPLISILPGGERVINILPLIGSTDKGSVDYRADLLTNSMIVIQRNLWFGSLDYLHTPEMESMRQGEGIIDIVNSYIGIALEDGLVGLGLFVSFFALVLLGVYRAMRLIPDRDSEEYLLGRVLLATQMAILTIIFTVSSISVIPIVYWSVAGLGVAYAQMVRKSAK